MWLTSQFRDDASVKPGDFAFHLDRFWRFLQPIRPEDKGLSQWWLKGWTEEEARLFSVFDPDGTPSATALAVLQNEYRRSEHDAKEIDMWNGRLDGLAPAAVSLDVDDSFSGNAIDLTLGGYEKSPAWLENMAAHALLVSALARAYTPHYVSAGSHDYYFKAVFEDKPGVNWMLYLPQVITAQQVPEAAALVPVDDEHGRRLGTIVVSVTDEVFSADNPRHVRAANEIEIRLVDQDLLPSYADFRR